MTNSIGEQLKDLREARGISLEEIAHRTRIRLEYLQAMEEGDEEFLPSKAQIRGFLRLYASELGVKVDDLQAEKHYLSSEKHPAKASAVEKPESTPVIPETDQIAEVEQESHPTEQPVQKMETTPEEVSTDIPDSELLWDTPSSTLIFEAIGKTLRNRREMLSLSLQDIHENIHIREKYLSNMEAGKFDLLPSPVQAKGMLQNYAEFLNLDVDSLILTFADGLQSRRLEKQQQLTSKTKTTAKELSPAGLQLKNFFSLDLLVIAALFIAFAGFVVWGANRIMSVNAPDTQETDLPVVSDILLATESSTPEQTTTPELPTEAGAEESTPQDQPTPIFTPLPNDNPINLVIIPRQQAWVQITSDSELVFEGRLLPGNAYDYSGQENVEVLTGNAGALQIYFNEENIGSLGLLGQVVDLIFTQNGLVRPTATNTPTITQTPQETLTPTNTPSPTITQVPTTSNP